jgi:hypothetical protein
MFKLFNFRITPVSMLCLAVAVFVYVIGVEYLARVAEFIRALRWLGEVLGYNYAVLLTLFIRTLEMLLLVVLPFRSHLQDRPHLVFVTTGVSFAITAIIVLAAWRLPPQVLVAVAISHVFTVAAYFIFIYRPRPVAKTTT